MVENDEELDRIEKKRAKEPAQQPSASDVIVVKSDVVTYSNENDLGNVAKQSVIDKLRNGDVTMSEAAEQLVDAQAAADAMLEHRDDYAEFAHQETTERHKGRLQNTKNTTNKAVNDGNEVFYDRFRPILEFDHSGITGIQPKSTPNRDLTRAYSKSFMVATLIIATIPWFIVALGCYIFKGLEAVINMIAAFSRVTRHLVVGLLITVLATLAIYVSLRLIEFYTGLKLIPW